MDKRIIQTASDPGVIAGAHVLAQGGSDTEARQAVGKEIARNDFAMAANDTITVNIPTLLMVRHTEQKTFPQIPHVRACRPVITFWQLIQL